MPEVERGGHPELADRLAVAAAIPTAALDPTPAPNPTAPAADLANLKVGDKVEVEWKGKYYPSVILAVAGPDQYKIHYDKFSASFDEVVPKSRIRPLQN